MCCLTGFHVQFIGVFYSNRQKMFQLISYISRKPLHIESKSIFLHAKFLFEHVLKKIMNYLVFPNCSRKFHPQKLIWGNIRIV